VNDMRDEIRQLFDFNRWANDRISAACAALPVEALRRDLGSSFPSVLATLTHIAASEWVWLERWNGNSPAWPPAWVVEDHAGLERHWSAVTRAQLAFVEALTDDGLQRVIEYRNLNGDAFAAKLWQLLRHVVNHSTYHRGQIVTMLRQLGATAPSTDLVVYYRERDTAV
jgi:uncharacterized damage-inducible protein DinB